MRCWVCSSVVGHIFTMCKILTSIPNTAKERKMRWFYKGDSSECFCLFLHMVGHSVYYLTAVNTHSHPDIHGRDMKERNRIWVQVMSCFIFFFHLLHLTSLKWIITFICYLCQKISLCIFSQHAHCFWRPLVVSGSFKTGCCKFSHVLLALVYYCVKIIGELPLLFIWFLSKTDECLDIIGIALGSELG